MSSTEPRPAAPDPSGTSGAPAAQAASRVSLFSAPAPPAEPDLDLPSRVTRARHASRGMSDNAASAVLVPAEGPVEDDEESYDATLSVAAYDDDQYLADVEYDDEPEEADELGPAGTPRGRLRARKVRRIVRYVSPWSVLKVSLLFYFSLWLILVVASVILWQVAVASGGIENVEKFLAKVFAEQSFVIDGRQMLRASAVAGVILVFAGTGFTTLMSLLFNVICDITGGIRFTVLELENTSRGRRR